MKKGPLHLRKAKDSAEALREELVFPWANSLWLSCAGSLQTWLQNHAHNQQQVKDKPGVSETIEFVLESKEANCLG
jgi:hypothetical protein